MERNFNWEKWYTRKVRVICHVVFWLLVTLLYYLAYSRLGGDYVWVFIAKELVVTTSLFYSVSWMISRWVSIGRIYPLILFVIFAYLWWLSWTYFICYVAQYFIPETDLGFQRYLGFFLNDGFIDLFRLSKIGTLSIDFITMVSIPLAPKLTKVLLESTTRMVRLKRDNIAMELDFLKSQVSPHFLFNILNSIYRMSEKNDPDTPSTVLRLSHLMRYVLYQVKDEEIQLSKEVEFIENYIDLVKLRYGGKVPLRVDIADMEEPYKIVPLILIPFVENAFKHGPDRSRHDAWVDISLRVSDDKLFLSVMNGVNHDAEKQAVGRFGLQNVRRRLQLHYPKRHDLNISAKDKSYCVELVVELKNKE